jgi:hypothetical protein
MRFFKGTFPNLPRGLNVVSNRFSVGVSDAQLSVTNVPPGTNLLGSAPAGRAYLIQMRNASAGGQQIRYTFGTPSFGPATGILLNPGDTSELVGWALGLNAIASAAGAVLDLLAVRTG